MDKDNSSSGTTFPGEHVFRRDKLVVEQAEDGVVCHLTAEAVQGLGEEVVLLFGPKLAGSRGSLCVFQPEKWEEIVDRFYHSGEHVPSETGAIRYMISCAASRRIENNELHIPELLAQYAGFQDEAELVWDECGVLLAAPCDRGEK